ncbi:MAG: hypothetical protein J5379_08415 [Clostridiales bacterium]|nr:hypothetical protein [Clostridiales bacterium]
MDYASIRNKYTEEMTNFFKGGAFPEKSSADLRFAIDSQRKRLSKVGLTMEKKFDKIGNDPDFPWKYEKYPYTYTVLQHRYNYEADFYRNGSLLSRSDISEETLYVGILEKENQGQESCTCKNCGHSDSLSKFISGCPMCGTTYEMVQSYPCVSGYYTRPTLLSHKVAKGVSKFLFLYFGIFGVILGLIAGLSISSEQGFGVIGTIAMTLFAIFIFAGGILLFALVFSIFMAGPLLAGKKMVQHNEVADVEAAKRTQERMETDLKKYIPDFSYEVFEEKVMSLLRGTIFTDDRKNLTIYDGNDDLSFMNNIVDVEYRGAVEYIGSSVADGILRMSVKAYVVCAFYHGGNMVEFKKQVFHLILAKKVKEEDFGFTIHAVNCKKCAGSFDAIHVHTCPYCGAEYHLIEDNWVVNQIRCVETAPMSKW